MLPRPARPAGTPPPRVASALGPGTEKPFVPPLAPAPPPAAPPTIHTAAAAAGTAGRSAVPRPARIPASADDEFTRLLAHPPAALGEGHHHHLRVPSRARFNPRVFAGALSSTLSGSPETLATARRITVTAAVTAASPAAWFLTRSANGLPVPAHGAGDVLDPSGSFLGMFAWVWILWVPVFAGSVAYACFQWLPSQRENPRHAWAGPLTAAAVVLAVLWLWAVHTGNPAAGFGLAGAQVALGLTSIHLTASRPAGSRQERLFTNGPLAVFLGVSILALLACLGSWLTQQQADAGGWGAEAWTLIALVSVVIGVTTICMTDRGQLAVAWSVVLGLAGMGLARLLEEPGAVWPAVGAFSAAFLILVSAGSRRHQVDHASRRAQREWLTAEASARAAAEEPEAAHT